MQEMWCLHGNRGCQLTDDEVLLIVGEERSKRGRRRRVNLRCQHHSTITKWKLKISMAAAETLNSSKYCLISLGF